MKTIIMMLTLAICLAISQTIIENRKDDNLKLQVEKSTLEIQNEILNIKFMLLDKTKQI